MIRQSIRRVLCRPYLWVPIAALLLYSLMGFFILPGLIRWYAPSFAQKRLHLKLNIGQVRINPFLLTVDIRNVRIRDISGKPLADFSRLYADAEISSLRNWALTFRDIRLDNPTFHLLIHPDGGTNLSSLSGPSAGSPQASNSKPFRMILQQVVIDNGAFFLTDQTPHTPVELALRNINLHMADLSTLAGRESICSLTATTPENETLQCNGHLSLIPVSFDGKLAVNALRLTTPWAFIRDNLTIAPPAGKLDIAANCHINADHMSFDDCHLGVSDLSLKAAVSNKPLIRLGSITAGPALIDVTQRKIQVQHLDLKNGALHIDIDPSGRANLAQIIASSHDTPGGTPEKPSPAAQKKTGASPSWAIHTDDADIQNIAVNVFDASRLKPVHIKIGGLGVHFSADITAGGRKSRTVLHGLSTHLNHVSIGNAISPKPIFSVRQISMDGGEVDTDKRSIAVTQVALNDGDVNFSLDKQGGNNWGRLFAPKHPVKLLPVRHAHPSAPPWTYRIQTLKLDKFRSDFSDFSVKSRSPVVTIQDFDARLSPIDGKSSIGAVLAFRLKQGGTVQIHGKVKTEKHLEIEAEITGKAVSLTSLQPYIDPYVTLRMKSALLSLKGAFHYGMPAAGGRIAYVGSMLLDRLQLVEPGVTKTFLGWNALHIPQMKLTLHPDRLDIRNIRLVKPVGEVIIAEDHTVNLTRVLRKRNIPRRAASPPRSGAISKGGAFPIHIGTVHIEGGDTGFADLSLKPQFMTQITALRGNISGFSSTGNQPSRIQLQGDVGQYGMVDIDGSINMLNPARSTDITMIFRNVEMTKLTPYSGKFAGRRITSGRLSVNLKYHIKDSKMTGENRIIVDNLTLGKHVDSPDAVNLPLDLAVALLKDASGRIDIGLPVSGDLNDPHFSYGHLIWKALVNVLAQIVTSPFRALEALFGGASQHIDAIVFAPGKSDLMPPEKEKLHTLSEMLVKRPQLQLIIQGGYTDTDGTALKGLEIRRAIAENAGKTWHPEEDMETPDFADAANRKAAEKMFRDRYGSAALKALKQSAEKNAKSASGKAAASLSKVLYEKLVEGAPLSSEALTDLANFRARNTVEMLEKTDGVPAGRVAIRPPEAQTPKGAPSVKFSLGAMPSPGAS